MKKFDTAFFVGLFMIAGIVCLGYLSVKIARMEILGMKGYDLVAIFSNSGGLKTGSSITIAGVDVGRIRKITLHDYQAEIEMNIRKDVKIQDDAIAAIKTKGLIGEKYIEISPGASDKIIPPGGRIRETLPPVDFEQLISQYVFGKIK